MQHDILSEDESQEIENQKTDLKSNSKLLSVLQKKDWPGIRNVFLEILRETKNELCANTIEGKSCESTITFTPPKVLKYIWWPTKKDIIKSLYRRKLGDQLLIDDLHGRLCNAKNRTVVICESIDASKLTGMGGIGKTLTANWYAHHYEQAYDHVIWIDCGEDSLSKSFKQLAIDVKLEDRNELVDLEHFARKIYEKLMRWKCLWIYDNAENYKGDNGIQKILPKEKENFFCLITSRSCEWGNEHGYGKISPFELTIFREIESLEFLKEHLKMECAEDELNDLCGLLGNLPLAMQLAIAALNKGKIDLQTYIRKHRFETIINETFDDYEKTINKNVRITMELIANEENGDKAYEMIVIFGYIRPDGIPINFFQDVLNLNDEELEEAIELLLKYSLISRDIKTSINNENETFLNIHRLLQQVIRHNAKETQKGTLRNILRCNGFSEFKLIPFALYADEDLRKEFPKVRVELVDQDALKSLIFQERFEESVQLSKFIDGEIGNSVTKFNYSVCLQKNGELMKSGKVLEEMRKEKIKASYNYLPKHLEMGLLKIDAEMSEELVDGHLLIWKALSGKAIKEMLEKVKNFTVIKTKESLTILLEILRSNLTHLNYRLRCDDNLFIHLTMNGKLKKISIRDSSCDISLLPSSLQKLLLKDTKVIIGEIALPNLRHLKFKRVSISCLNHFRSAQLTHIQLFNMGNINVDLLPESVENVKITSSGDHGVPFSAIENGPMKQLSKLFLNGLSFDSINQYLRFLQPSQLIINCQGGNHTLAYYSSELVELFKKDIQTIAVGKVYQEKEYLENYKFSNYVDTPRHYYLLERRNAKAIEENEFKEFRFSDNEVLQSSYKREEPNQMGITHLRQLFWRNKNEELVRLAKKMYNEQKSQTTKFNYAVCLQKNGELEEASRILEELYYNETFREEKEKYFAGLKIFDTEISKALFGGHLLVIQWKIGKKEKVQAILEERNSYTVIPMQDWLNTLLEILSSQLITSNYSFRCNGYWKAVNLLLDGETREFHLQNCSFTFDIPLPQDLQELVITTCEPLIIGLQSFDEWVPKGLKKLVVEDPFKNTPDKKAKLRSEKARLQSFTLGSGWPVDFIKAEDLAKDGFHYFGKTDFVKCYFCHGTFSDWKEGDEPLKKHRKDSSACNFIADLPVGNIPIEQEMNIREIIVSPDSVSSVEYLDLSQCSLNIDSVSKINPKELKLTNVSFMRNGNEIKPVNPKEFTTYGNINKMILQCDEKKNISIDMSQEVVKLQYLELNSVEVLNWKESKWIVQKLRLGYVPFIQQSKMKVKEIETEDSVMDLSVLPPTIQKLSLSRTQIAMSGRISLPSLEYLQIRYMSPIYAQFFSAPLTHLKLKYTWGGEINTDHLPLSITHLELSPFDSISGGVKKLEKLILKSLPLDKMKEVLKHFQVQCLVIKNQFSSNELIQILMIKDIETIAIGEIDWKETNFQKSTFCRQLGRKSRYYFVKEGKGQAIEDSDFDELCKLYNK